MLAVFIYLNQKNTRELSSSANKYTGAGGILRLLSTPSSIFGDETTDISVLKKT